jgi:hypothetical protein
VLDLVNPPRTPGGRSADRGRHGSKRGEACSVPNRRRSSRVMDISG